MNDMTPLPKIASHLIWELMDGNVVIVHPSHGKVRVLNGLGTEIWQFIAEANSSFEEVIEQISQQYNIAQEQAKKDVLHFFADLEGRGLIHWQHPHTI